MISLNKLPERVLVCILGYVGHGDLLSVRLASRGLREAVWSVDACYYKFVVEGKGKSKWASYSVSPEYEDSKRKDVSFEQTESLEDSDLGFVLAKTRTISINMGMDTWNEVEVCLIYLLRYLERAKRCSLAVVVVDSVVYPLRRMLLTMLDETPLNFDCAVSLKVTKTIRSEYSGKLEFCGNINKLTLSVQRVSAEDVFAAFAFTEQKHWKSLTFKAGGGRSEKSLKLEKLSAALDGCPRIDYLELNGLPFESVESLCQFPRYARILKIDNCHAISSSKEIVFYGETLILSSAVSVLQLITFHSKTHLKISGLCQPTSFISALSEKPVKSLSLELPSTYSKGRYSFPEKTAKTVEELHISINGRGPLNPDALIGWIKCLPGLRTLHVIPASQRLWPTSNDKDKDNIVRICPNHINVTFH